MSTEIKEYSATEAGLADLRQRYEGVIFDVSTVKGDKEARSARSEIVKLRTSLEAKRKDIKAPALAYCQLIDSEAKRITGEILKLEEPIDLLIKADEKRRAEEKLERERIELARVEAIQQRISAIQSAPVDMLGRTALEIKEVLEELSQMTIDETLFEEFTLKAQGDRSDAVRTLNRILNETMAQEAEQARLKAEREALAAEQERMRIAAETERQRLAAEQAEQARLLAEKRRLEDEARAAEQAKLNAEMADFRRQQAAFEAEKQAAILATTVDEPLPFDPEPTPELDDDFVVPPQPVQARTQATMKLGELNELLAPITLTADGLAELGFKPVSIDRTAKLYNASDVPAICNVLIQRLKAVGRQQEAA